MARTSSHSFHWRLASDSHLPTALTFRAVALIVLVLVLVVPHSLSAAFPHNHSASGITAVDWLTNYPEYGDSRESSLDPSHESHNAKERRTSLLERVSSAATPTLLADSQLRALETLNAAWQLWPSNSNRSRRCDQWEYIQCNAQGFIVAVAPPFIENNVTMPLNVFSAMPYLRRLVLSEVYKIQGPISDLPLPPSLRVLDLLGTGVSGSLPSSILSLSALAYLDIGYTSLSGSLPSSLTRLSRLTYLNIGAMSIIGRLQDLSWLSSLTNLRSLVLDRMASVEGDLSSFTFLTALTNMQSLSMGTNGHWTGDLPVLLGSLTSLTYLDLSGLASAQFPRWVMDLTALRFLDVTHDNDYRTGVVPQDLYRLRQLEHFDASGNGLVGSLPEYWTALNHLTFLSFGSNKIEGSIPLTFSALTSLSTLNLRLNSMDGTIPRVFSTALSSLDLSTNAFSGPIPPFLGSLTGLTSMDLSGNNFTGTIPESLTGLTNMFDMLLFNNQLTSGLDVVERMTWLGKLELHCLHALLTNSYKCW